MGLKRSARWLPSAVLAAVSAVAFGAAGLAVGGWVGWRGAPSLPDADSVRAVAATALPGRSLGAVERHDAVYGSTYPDDGPVDDVLGLVLGGDGYQRGSVRVTADQVTDPAPAMHGAADRLRADGWRDGSVSVDRYGASVTLTRADEVLTLSITNLTGDRGTVPGRYEPTVLLAVHRAEPSGVGTGMLLGWLIGLAAGALLALAAGLRARAHAAPRRRLAAILAPVGLGLLLPVSLFTTSTLVPAVREAAEVPWSAYLFFLLRMPANLGVLVLLVAAVLLALPAGHRTGLPSAGITVSP